MASSAGESLAKGSLKQAYSAHWQLRQEDVGGAVLYANRLEMLHALPKGGVVCEVGTREGHFARKILDIAEPKELHIIDIDWRVFERSNFTTELDTGRARLYERDSSEALREFPDAFFDWVYIDGDHNYPGAKRDVVAAESKVKPEGYIVCNDYIHWTRRHVRYGVIRAANELCLQSGWRIRMIALQRGGYNDVALQRKSRAG